ncbi:IS1182 family transposase [Streptomyces sp. WMMB303]|uniref:IS1182 family transposase n=1 Tax=Streptomyces sp. WMMB303 TaxID=3034154 RepID=UPI0023EDB1FA|nr:IS1182 family transposase [Streptomyces sp. WMMB303]MDF4249769.1 IS1182 family transposase [Streptomyces sp. WMMB303]MDF4251814.1 IS1182 family transposase [Streptomyces sp. WMMB303]MDF4252851.1 IS1182 family transposase [Streptomyces sp. WMMB303]MDF4253864.1 IS1182 family transposase [Streptomyces sp. WMMB303]
MSMQPKGSGEIPAETVRVARAAFPKGSLAIRLRDGLGPLFTDEEFADLFPARGRHAWSPAGLALVSVLQFVEGLTDRQAAEAVRARIDVKYALGLELDDPGFNFSVLSEFRDRLAQADGGRRVLDGILTAAREKGLVKKAGRARTDSTHVLSAARDLCWLEMVAETLRSALNALAQTAPDWLAGVAEPDWFRHYATRAEDSRFPTSRAKRDEVGLRIGLDGTRLLAAVFAPGAPDGLRALAEVETLRQMWVQHFHQVEGEVRRRDPKDRPPGALRPVTPYDTDARTSIKRDTAWDGYKVHLTETCEPDTPNLITNVATTVATVSDRSMAETIHTQLTARDCTPGEHWVDAGYPTGATLISARDEHGIALHGPLQADNSAQSSTDSGFGQDAFIIDWGSKQATCPGGKTSINWSERLSQTGQPVLRVRFSVLDCRPCPVRRECINSPSGKSRELRLRHHDEHHALQTARAEQKSDEWKERYKVRAGVEGTIAQGVQRCGLRRSRYRGLTKTSLQHQLTGAAINLARVDAHLTGTPRARTRTSHFARLRPADQTIDGAKKA